MIASLLDSQGVKSLKSWRFLQEVCIVQYCQTFLQCLIGRHFEVCANKMSHLINVIMSWQLLSLLNQNRENLRLLMNQVWKLRFCWVGSKIYILSNNFNKRENNPGTNFANCLQLQQNSI